MASLASYYIKFDVSFKEKLIMKFSVLVNSMDCQEITDQIYIKILDTFYISIKYYSANEIS